MSPNVEANGFCNNIKAFTASLYQTGGCGYISVGGAHLQVVAGGVEVFEEAQNCSLWTRDTGIWLL